MSPIEKEYEEASALFFMCQAYGLDPEQVADLPVFDRDELVSAIVQGRFESHCIHVRSVAAMCDARRSRQHAIKSALRADQAEKAIDRLIDALDDAIMQADAEGTTEGKEE